MNTSPRDHLSALCRRAANGRVHASNAWHRAAGNRIHGARIGISNRRNRRATARGRSSRLSGINAAVSSRLPVYRNRINRAHGNPHREDARLHRAGNRSLARAAINRQIRPIWYPGEPPALEMSARQMTRLRKIDRVPDLRASRGRAR